MVDHTGLVHVGRTAPVRPVEREGDRWVHAIDDEPRDALQEGGIECLGEDTKCAKSTYEQRLHVRVKPDLDGLARKRCHFHGRTWPGRRTRRLGGARQQGRPTCETWCQGLEVDKQNTG